MSIYSHINRTKRPTISLFYAYLSYSWTLIHFLSSLGLFIKPALNNLVCI